MASAGTRPAVGLLRKGLANAALRMVSVASRFLLMLVLVRFLPPAELGRYGIFSSTLSLGIFLLGLEFHIFNAREILQSPREQWPALIRDQFLLHGAAYLVAPWLLLPIFAVGILPWQHAPALCLLLLLEHALQELGRILVVIGRPLPATAVLFLRNGAWVYLVLAAMLLRPDLRRLEVVWICWAVGLVAGHLLAAWHLRDLPWRNVRGVPVARERIRRGLSVSWPYLLASVAGRSMYTVDRYLLQHHWGNEVVGVYTFFSGVANSIQIALEAAVVQIRYPTLVPSGAEPRPPEQHRALLRGFARSMVVGALLLVALAALGIFLVLPWTRNAAYARSLDVYWGLLLAGLLHALALIPHYALYAQGADRAVTRSTIAGFFVALAADLLLIPALGALGAALGLCVGLLAVGLLKALAVRSARTATR